MTPDLLPFVLSLSKGFDRLSLNGVVSRTKKNINRMISFP